MFSYTKYLALSQNQTLFQHLCHVTLPASEPSFILSTRIVEGLQRARDLSWHRDMSPCCGKNGLEQEARAGGRDTSYKSLSPVTQVNWNWGGRRVNGMASIPLSEISPTEKDKYCMISLTGEISKKAELRETERSGFTRDAGQEWGRWGNVVKRYKLPVMS